MCSWATANHKGNVAEAAIAAAAIKLGVDVIKPLVEHTRYDLIFDLRPRLLRVQCKWAPLKGDVIVVRLVSSCVSRAGASKSAPRTAPMRWTRWPFTATSSTAATCCQSRCSMV